MSTDETGLTAEGETDAISTETAIHKGRGVADAAAAVGPSTTPLGEPSTPSAGVATEEQLWPTYPRQPSVRSRRPVRPAAERA